MMADPVFVDCDENTWVLVAENVVTGQIWRAAEGINYIHTYRDTGGDEPTDVSEGMPIFVNEDNEVEQISASAPIDVYIYAIGGAGRVRVDL